MAVNRYPSTCAACGGPVVVNGGILHKQGSVWMTFHLTCEREGKAAVDTIRIGGRDYTRNKKGRCEDAPCCGCCTI